MGLQMFAATVLGLLCMHVTLGQQQPSQLGPCSKGLEQELPQQCLQSNGIDHQGTLFIISVNRTGKLPDGMTYNQFKDLMCSTEKQDLAVPCILQLMQKWNQTQCEDQDRLIMSARGGQMLALMEGFCGDPCEQAAMQTLIQCFAAVKIDPSPILNQNATIITDKFSFVGNSSDTATNFCNSRERLFNCLSPLSNDCPKIVHRLYTLGVDMAGLERATKVLCDDLDTYLETIKCSSAFQQCQEEVSLLFRQVQEERYRMGKTKPSQYQGRLCQTKLSKVDCELKKFGDSCGAASTEMVSTFECTSMPLPCREGSETLPVYESLCRKVTTPSPAVTVRPTRPVRPVNPVDSDDDVDGELGRDNPYNDGAVVLAGSTSTLVCSAAVVVLGVGWMV